MGAGERLRSMREQYVGLLELYTPKHPGVVSLKRELYGLELQSGGGSGAIEPAGPHRADPRTAHRGPLAPSARRVRDAAPRAAGGRLVDQYKRLRSARRERRRGGADNPAYVSIQAQRQNAMTERSVLDDPARRSHRPDRRSRAPPARDAGRGARLRALQRELQSEQTKFADVRQKLLEAQLAENLETEQKGERFTLIEPPMQAAEAGEAQPAGDLGAGTARRAGRRDRPDGAARTARHPGPRPPAGGEPGGGAAARDHPVGGGRGEAKPVRVLEAARPRGPRPAPERRRSHAW